MNEEREHGTQPLDGLMTAWGLGNHGMVNATTEHLTPKQVQRARSGRTLTLPMMQKVTRALNRDGRAASSKQIGDRIRAARRRPGLSQEQLANARA